MIRTDIITTVGRKYLTSNIENEEFSYGKALKSIGKDYTNFLSQDAKRAYKDLDMQMINYQFLLRQNRIYLEKI